MTPDFKLDKVRLFNCDCMDFMAEIPDNHYDLAIVDPPYGIGLGSGITGELKTNFGGKSNKIIKTNYVSEFDDSHIPDKEYFKELFRVSKNQIVWGVNYYKYAIFTSGRIVWDKDNGRSNQSDCELAFISNINSVRKFKFRWHGLLQQDMKNKEKRIHPTQKPIQLYKWLLANYAKPGDKIFDSHGGSFSSACAALDMGYEFDGCELDTDYFQDAINRIRNHSQLYIDLS